MVLFDKTWRQFRLVVSLWQRAARPRLTTIACCRHADASYVHQVRGLMTKAPSTPATMSKQHRRMLKVERFFGQSRMLLRHCCRLWQRCCRFRQKMLPVLATMSNKISSFRQSRNKLNLFNLLDFVERTISYDKLLQHCCRFWQQSRMLLRQSCLLLRHCCWCRRGITNWQCFI